MPLPQDSIIVMKGDDYLMYEGATVIFDNMTVEQAQWIVDVLFGFDESVVAKHAILFADAKVNWSEIKDEIWENDDVR